MRDEFQNVGSRSFSLGDVFSLIGRSVAHNAGLVAAGWGLIVAASLVGQLMIGQTISSEASPDAMWGRAAVMLVTFVVNMAASAIATVMFTFAVVSESHERKAKVRESIRAALPLILPVTGFSVLWSLGVTIGSLLFLIPGLILVAMWAIGVPVLVVEDTGVIEAFGRSRELTKGHRWPIFGALLLLAFIYYGALLAFGNSLGGSEAMVTAAASGQFTILAIFGAIVGSLFYLAWGLLSPAIYTELRRSNEGADIEGLERIFA